MGVLNWPRTLAWSEFTELDRAPAGTKEYAAISVAQPALPEIKLKPDGRSRSLRTEDFDFEVEVVTSETWVVKGKQTTDLLSHEQGHFDIAGLVVWELYRKIIGARAPSPAELQRVVNQHMAWAARKLERLAGSVGRYDVQSKHGLEATQQKRWKDLIADSMKHNYRALPG